MVAPELLMQYALEKHYKVQRKPRVVRCSTGGSDLLEHRGRATPPASTPPLPPPQRAASNAPVYSALRLGADRVDVDSLTGYLDEQPIAAAGAGRRA